MKATWASSKYVWRAQARNARAGLSVTERVCGVLVVCSFTPESPDSECAKCHVARHRVYVVLLWPVRDEEGIDQENFPVDPLSGDGT